MRTCTVLAILASLICAPALRADPEDTAVRLDLELPKTRPDDPVNRPESPGPPANVRGGPQLQLDLAGVYQLATGVDDGGRFSVVRTVLEPRLSWGVSRTFSWSVSAGVRRDRYRFEGRRGLAGLDPWDDVWTLSLSGFARWGFAEDWTLLLIPSLRTAFERGARPGDGLGGGGLIGVSYAVNDALSLGAGVGVFSQIEDDPNVFPMLIVDWKLSDTLRLRTGGGLAATQGPGLRLEWAPDPRWTVGLDARARSLRLRLDDRGVAPDGVGEERAYTAALSVTHRWSAASLSLLGGVDLGGRLRLEDARGDRLRSEGTDPAPFLGLVFEARF